VHKINPLFFSVIDLKRAYHLAAEPAGNCFAVCFREKA